MFQTQSTSVLVLPVIRTFCIVTTQFQSVLAPNFVMMLKEYLLAEHTVVTVRRPDMNLTLFLAFGGIS